ncbi:MAG TPA: DUF1549 and DUF1553 domain-containing protein [Tepidisphaeraceae bacterium]|nr:DUF1549 and DUF1553 domain-containing protein [Tepidisphaeraceae bacterium]
MAESKFIAHLVPLLLAGVCASALAAEPQTEGATSKPTVVTEADRQFWSFVPPKAHEPPATKNPTWPRSRVDRHLLAKMEAAGVGPSEEAPRHVLVRRLSFDLTGLPPTPADVDGFLLDNSPDAYAKLVERLLTSPAFGERMASLWLPLARYAEDQAHQVGDDTKYFYPNAWKYRRWVIDAFNRDLPYDKFLLYQIAADKADGATPADLAGLGFLGLGPKYYNRDRLEVMSDEWEDRVDTVTRSMLGLTVACARCHDHKFDPIPTEDYYALAGVFASTRMVNKQPDGTVQDKEVEAPKVNPEVMHVVQDGDAKDLHVFVRGNVERKGDVAPRRFLTVLSRPDASPFKDGSGRSELAKAIADRNNPLTARVMVNRVWAMLFGVGLVPTPSNFGRSGQPPSHPELLDDLAVRFMDNGWSVKWLVRELVTSAAYRQTSRASADSARRDPANVLLWRMNRRRLSIEQWRDGVLFACGKLDAGDGKSIELDDPANCRRTVYARVSRLKLNELLMQFDYPDANVHAEGRATTNTSTQKLFMLNSPFMAGQAKALAARVAKEAPADETARVRHAYRLLFAREPDGAELEMSLSFVRKPENAQGMTRWEQLAQVMLISNEAMYVD